MSERQVLISAGEASSDMYAARLATALRARTGATFFGMGGPRMREAGVELIADYHEVAVVGITEVLHKIPAVIGVQNRLAREAAKRGAALAVLVDSPGTHLGVARRLKKADIPVGYFIGPQVWAWRAGRVRVVKRLVQRMVVIFPFEEKIYRDAGVPVDFVGHPLVDTVRATMSRAEFASRAWAGCGATDRNDSAGQPAERDCAELCAGDRCLRAHRAGRERAIRACGGARVERGIFRALCAAYVRNQTSGEHDV